MQENENFRTALTLAESIEDLQVDQNIPPIVREHVTYAVKVLSLVVSLLMASAVLIARL